MKPNELPLYRIPPGTTLFALRDGLWAAGQRMRKVDLGSRELERELVSRLTSGRSLSELTRKYSEASLARALDALQGAGIIAVGPERIHFANLLSDARLPAELGPATDIVRPQDVKGASLLLLLGAATSEAFFGFLRSARAEGVAVMAAWLSGSNAIAFGFDDGVARPCLHCALLYDSTLRSQSARIDAFGQISSARLEAAAVGEAPRGLIEQVALSWLAALAQAGAARPTPGRALSLDTSTWRTSWESYPSHPSCFCVGPAVTSAEPRPSGWRDASGRRFTAVICADAGGSGRPARALFRQSRIAFEQTVDDFGVASATGENATLRAYAEGVERFCMLHAWPDVGPTARLRLAQPALEHDQLLSLLHREDEHRQPGFRHPRYSGNLPLEWSWAVQPVSGERVLVPTSLVGRSSPGTARLVDATSNGYAAHTNRESAVQLALLEVIERDAVLRSWYLGLPLRRIAGVLPVAPPRPETEVRTFLVTSDIDLPVVLAVARLPEGGLRATAAAALTFEEAWCKAGLELQAALEALGSRRLADEALPDLHDTAHRYGPIDYLKYYLDPARARPALELLWRSADSLAPSSLSSKWPVADSGAEGTSRILRALDRAGLAAWVVDRSLPDVFGGDWHVVRALVPGAVEVSWGNAYRRLASPRIVDALAHGARLNPLPHLIA